jgi:hypothetical protein
MVSFFKIRLHVALTLYLAGSLIVAGNPPRKGGNEAQANRASDWNCARAVVDLSEVKHLTLHDPAPGEASIFHQVPITCSLPFLFRVAQRKNMMATIIHRKALLRIGRIFTTARFGPFYGVPSLKINDLRPKIFSRGPESAKLG